MSLYTDTVQTTPRRTQEPISLTCETKRDTAVVVFTRSPRTEAKQFGLGAGARVRVAETMIARTLRTVTAAAGRTPVILAVDESADGDRIRRHAPRGIRRIAQSGESFDQRFLGALRSVTRKGFRRIVVVGTDTPTLLPRDLERAIVSPPGSIVVGPSRDGGFYLLAVDAGDLGLLDGLPWQTSRVFAALETRLRARGLPCETLATRRDVDTAQDVRVLRSLLERACFQLLGGHLAGVNTSVRSIQAANERLHFQCHPELLCPQRAPPQRVTPC
jgi:glycosyltransferase A (GT-A) superfamily protein (DUF2064 family)